MKNLQPRKVRREQENFKPVYNGVIFKAKHTLVQNEKKPYAVKLVTTYEKIS